MNKILTLAILLISLSACKSQDTIESRNSTASPNVSVINHKFIIPGLERERIVRIYLPEDYPSSKEKYPVLYMHDGQNLFDDSTSYVGEWGVDENLNHLAQNNGFNIIAVGIDHGSEKRMSELSPWYNPRIGKGEGQAYMQFIVEQVKPYIDSTYRTLPDRNHTAIMGSSMGGLISHYAIYEYPDIFSKVGIFSPSYWISNEVFELTEKKPVPVDTRIFLLIGKKEGSMVQMAENMNNLILKSGHPEDNLMFIVDPEGEHNEAFWRKRFTDAVKWMFGQ